MFRELQVHLNELGKVIHSVPWHDKAIYGAFLAQTYYYVNHSTRLLALAASRFQASEERIHRRFIKHATEEMRHEILALRDLKNLGLSVESYHEFPSTRAFYQTQYYMIEHVSPWSFWGYILMLEGLAVNEGAWLYDQIKRHHGEQAGSFVKVHAVDDVGHMAEAEQALRLLPDGQRPLVLEQVANSRFYYSAMLEQCKSYAAAHFKDGAGSGDPTTEAAIA
jgi:Iron-containing redox enzyme